MFKIENSPQEVLLSLQICHKFQIIFQSNLHIENDVKSCLHFLLIHFVNRINEL